MTAALLAGAVAGLGVAMPVGAITTLIALLSARHGWRVGAAAGLGAATVDGLFATVALLFGALLTPLLTAYRTPLRWAAAAVLVVIAALLLRPAWQPARPTARPARRVARPARRAASPPTVLPSTIPPSAASPSSPGVPLLLTASSPAAGSVTNPTTDHPAGDDPTDDHPAIDHPADDGPIHTTSPLRAYVTFVGLTVVNPATVVYFAALTTGGSVGIATSAGVATSVRIGAAFVVGAFAASAAWQLVIAGAGHGAGRALTGPRGRRWTAIAGAAVVAGLAVHTALGA